jgi:hydroxypyruvate isomerase
MRTSSGDEGMSFRISANLSILYSGLPANERPRAAAADGFAYAESWWPFSTPTPDSGELQEFCAAFESAGVELVALNLDHGDAAAGDRGLLAHPRHGKRVEENLETVAGLVGRTSCRIVNALYGNRLPELDADSQEQYWMGQIVRVADRLADVGATVVVETLNLVDSPLFPLTDIAVTADLVRRANLRCRHQNVRLLLDTYHLATMGTDPVAAVRAYGPLIGHVQFADHPGRGRPGSGAIDFVGIERELRAIGYGGFIGYEYDPAFSPEITREGIA